MHQTVGGSVTCWRMIVKKAWLHPDWEHAMQQWYNWLHERKKKDEERTREEEHEKLVG